MKKINPGWRGEPCSEPWHSLGTIAGRCADCGKRLMPDADWWEIDPDKIERRVAA